MVLILAGKSSCGKDTIQGCLEKEYGFEPIVSTTSRPKRDGEIEGIAYHFVSREEFLKQANEGKFMEQRHYNTLVNGNPDTWYYGAPKIDNSKDKKYVVVVDVSGTQEFLDFYGKQNCFVVGVEIEDTLRESRAMLRGSFDKTEWDRRFADDEVKFSRENMDTICNAYVSNNGPIEETVRNVMKAYQSYQKTMGSRYEFTER